MTRLTLNIGISFGQIDTLVDGLGEFSCQIATSLAERADELHGRHGIVIHLHMPRQWHGRFGPQVRYLDRHSLQRHLHLRGTRFSLWHTLNQLSRLRPPMLSRHRIVTIHDLNFLYTSEPQDKEARALRRIRHSLSWHDQVTTLTHYVEGDIHRHLGWQRPIEVIPNGVRDLSHDPAEPVEHLRQRPFMFHLSRMASSKNPDCLLDLARIWPEQHVVLAGPASTESARLRERIRTERIDNAEILENISEAQKTWLFQHCRAFLFPSLTEGFGLPPLEAMKFGKPVFVSSLTCLPEVVGDAGGYLDSFEPAAMRQRIERDLPRLENQPDQIRLHASRYDWRQTTSDYLRLYLRLLGLDSSAV